MSGSTIQTHRSLIIGGHDAEPDRYPYFTSFDHWGGGVLIAPDIILTVGHCYPPLSQPVVVKVGRYSFTEDDDNEIYSIQSIHRHPDYTELDWDEKVNDFNLFKIDGLSKKNPIKINRSPSVPTAGTIVTVIGEGSMSANPATFQATASDILQEAQLNILANDECSKYDDPTRNVSYSNRIFDSMVCTRGGKHNERDGCAFDSGSPLIMTQTDEDVVVGLVSWGISCADPVFPSVNARISYAADWIDKTVCEVSDADPADLKDFGCVKHGWLYNLFHPKSNTTSNELTLGIGNMQAAAMAHHILFFGIVAVAVAAGVMRKLRVSPRSSRERSEREPLQGFATSPPQESYQSL